MLKGIPVSEGYAIGQILILDDEIIDTRKIPFTTIDQEILIFHEAISLTKTQLMQLKDIARSKFGIDTAAIFDAHYLIADDPELYQATLQMIREHKVSACYAIETVIDRFIELFDHIEDEYMKSRSIDLNDVKLRIIKNALHQEVVDLESIEEPVILVSKDIKPSLAAQLDPKFILGFITEAGGKTSHSAIFARLLEIPAITGVKDLLKTIKNHTSIIMDGYKGDILLTYTKEIADKYLAKMEKQIKEKERLTSLIGQTTVTKDGKPCALLANITSKKDIDIVKSYDAEGIGLFRTEFLYLDKKTLPTEDEQYHEYHAVLKTMFPKPVTIRTLDIGGDKSLPTLHLKKEENPFLGKRAIRLCLEEQDLFKTQLRALLRASTQGNLRIMFPMIATLEEFLSAKNLLEKEKEKLLDEGYEIGSYQLGIMVEIPSAALNANIFAKHVDFFSIGTNDLVQYTFAADRMHEDLEYLYQPFNPAIIALIQMVTNAARKYHIKVSVCGELASDPKAALLLLGLGIDELSMTPTKILKQREIIQKISYEKIKELTKNVIELESEKDIQALILKNMPK